MNKFLLLLVFIFSFVYLFLSIRQPYGSYDEGLTLYGAKLVSTGSVPYRDFWTLYPPGQFLNIALLFKMFGISAFVERIYDVAVRSFLVTTVFYILLARSLRIFAFLVSTNDVSEHKIGQNTRI